jgi:hypothetical protein
MNQALYAHMNNKIIKEKEKKKKKWNLEELLNLHLGKFLKYLTSCHFLFLITPSLLDDILPSL